MSNHIHFISIIVSLILTACGNNIDGDIKLPNSQHSLSFDQLAEQWDEAIPLGNGMLGALIWQKDGNLRISIDRADLWDLRPVREFDRPEFNYPWVYQQVLNNDYAPVQKLFDLPYDRDPAPTKIPACALEFDISRLGKVASVQLILDQAICRIDWQNGTQFEIFIHATEPVGLYRWNNLKQSIKPELIAPQYQEAIKTKSEEKSVVAGNDLLRLGYSEPEIKHSADGITYHQKGWQNFSYDTSIKHNSQNGGIWSLVANPSWDDEEM